MTYACGELSEEALAEFTRFYLTTCLDQVTFMEGLMQPDSLRTRILLWTEEEIRLDRLPPKSGAILEAVLCRGATPPASSAPATARHAGWFLRSSTAVCWSRKARAPHCAWLSGPRSHHAGCPGCFQSKLPADLKLWTLRRQGKARRDLNKLKKYKDEIADIPQSLKARRRILLCPFLKVVLPAPLEPAITTQRGCRYLLPYTPSIAVERGQQAGPQEKSQVSPLEAPSCEIKLVCAMIRRGPE